MAVPTYKCPFKADAGAGITCEGSACAAYDKDKEHCAVIEFVQRRLALDGKSAPNNV